MQQQIKQRWDDGYNIQNIALKERVTAEYVCRVLGFGFKGERKRPTNKS